MYSLAVDILTSILGVKVTASHSFGIAFLNVFRISVVINRHILGGSLALLLALGFCRILLDTHLIGIVDDVNHYPHLASQRKVIFAF